MSNTEPRIYVACLASYNAGVLHGAWIDATQDIDQVNEEIGAILRTSPHPNVRVTCPTCEGNNALCCACLGYGKVPSAEEWAIHDHEGFLGCEVSEHADLESVCSLAAFLDKYGEAGAAWVQNGESLDEDRFEASYAGEYSSVEDYAYELAEESGDLDNVPDYLRYAIDWGQVGEAKEINGDIWTSNGHVFRNICNI